MTHRTLRDLRLIPDVALKAEIQAWHWKDGRQSADGAAAAVSSLSIGQPPLEQGATSSGGSLTSHAQSSYAGKYSTEAGADVPAIRSAPVLQQPARLPDQQAGVQAEKAASCGGAEAPTQGGTLLAQLGNSSHEGKGDSQGQGEVVPTDAVGACTSTAAEISGGFHHMQEKDVGSYTLQRATSVPDISLSLPGSVGAFGAPGALARVWNFVLDPTVFGPIEGASFARRANFDRTGFSSSFSLQPFKLIDGDLSSSIAGSSSWSLPSDVTPRFARRPAARFEPSLCTALATLRNRQWSLGAMSVRSHSAPEHPTVTKRSPGALRKSSPCCTAAESALGLCQAAECVWLDMCVSRATLLCHIQMHGRAHTTLTADIPAYPLAHFRSMLPWNRPKQERPLPQAHLAQAHGERLDRSELLDGGASEDHILHIILCDAGAGRGAVPEASAFEATAQQKPHLSVKSDRTSSDQPGSDKSYHG